MGAYGCQTVAASRAASEAGSPVRSFRVRFGEGRDDAEAGAPLGGPSVTGGGGTSGTAVDGTAGTGSRPSLRHRRVAGRFHPVTVPGR